MKRLSVERAFLWTSTLVGREWRLLLPVALAFLALPPLAIELISRFTGDAAIVIGGDLRQLPAVAGWIVLAMLAVLVLAVIGGLAISALALVPAISVGEAIRLALRRTPAQLAAGVLVFAGIALAGLLVAVVVAVARMPAGMLQAMLVGFIFGATFLLMAPLMLLSPILVERRLGPVQALREAFVLVRGTYWRLLSAAMVYLIGAIVVLLAVKVALGGLVLLGGTALGQNEAAQTIVTVVDAIVNAATSAGFYVLIAACYRQIAPARG